MAQSDMKKEKLNFNDYLSEAFNADLDVKGLGSIPLNKLFVMGSAIMGFGNPGFWMLGIALEFIYLWYLSTNPRFQKYIQGKQLLEHKKAQTEKLSQMVYTLEPSFRTRLQKLNSNLKEVNKLMDWNSSDRTGFLNKEKISTLNQLPTLFLKLLKTKQLIQESLSSTKSDSIKNEIKELDKKLAKNNLSPALIKSIEGNKAIQQKRLDNLSQAKENEMLVEMELQRIESQLNLVKEEIALDSSPEGISANIDVINNTLGETEAWMDTHSDFLRKLSGPDIEMEFDSEVFDSPPPIPQQREME